MQEISTAWLFAAIGCAITIAAFLGGRISASHKDGERWGKLEATLGHIQDDVREIKTAAEKDSDEMRKSLRRVHERIDRHLRDAHGISPGQDV